MVGFIISPLNSVSPKQEFIKIIEGAILSGQLRPGERLPSERVLASQGQVSRPIIHEGLLFLENKGLIHLRPRHGALVLDFRINGKLDLLKSLILASQSNESEEGKNLVSDLADLRILIEKDMVKDICHNKASMQKNLDQLSSLNQKMEIETDSQSLASLDFEFHLGLSLIANNRLYPLLFNTLKETHKGVLKEFYQIKNHKKEVFNYHKKLIKSLEDKDEKMGLYLIDQLDSYRGYSI